MVVEVKFMVQKIDIHDVVQLVESLSLEHVDKRGSGGAFWVIGGQELTSAMAKLSDYGFSFQFKEGGGRSSSYKDAWWYKPLDSADQKPAKDNKIESTIIEILVKHFPNGIRPNSIIDLNKLKKCYFETAGVCMSEQVSDIVSVVEDVGLKHGEKVYVLSASDKQELGELFRRLQSEGNRIFYYDEFYDAHANLLQEMNIFSSALLRTVFSTICPSLCYYSEHCKTDAKVSVESEILRCFESAVSLSYDQFKTYLPYVPISKIRHVLACDSDFINVTVGVYTHVNNIEFDKTECRDVCSKIEGDIKANGFASLASVDYPESLELNPELSETAIKNGIYQVCLADRFEKRGNIITERGSAQSSISVLEDFCSSNACLTVDELSECEKDINGYVNNQSLGVAYKSMIRIDKDTFVSDELIQFDVVATDCALSRFFSGDVIPLKLVTSFMSFPYISGYPWNSYLLESYCRRFSEQFGFRCLTVNSLNVGAIFKKAANFANYAEVLAAAVAVEPIKLTPKEVGDYLAQSGYIARRTNFVAEVVSQARLLRERIN